MISFPLDLSGIIQGENDFLLEYSRKEKCFVDIPINFAIAYCLPSSFNSCFLGAFEDCRESHSQYSTPNF